MRPALLATLALLAGAPAQAAGPLAPTRPSDVVALTASFEPPTCAGGTIGATLDRRMTPEGTYVPVAVPAKRVLVVTELRWVVDTLPNVEVAAIVRTGPEVGGFIGLVLPGARSDGNGRAIGEAKLDPGLVVRNPAELCVVVFPSGGSVIAPGNLSGSGFFAKDN
jgi:hypothetical protein